MVCCSFSCQCCRYASTGANTHLYCFCCFSSFVVLHFLFRLFYFNIIWINYDDRIGFLANYLPLPILFLFFYCCCCLLLAVIIIFIMNALTLDFLLMCFNCISQHRCRSESYAKAKRQFVCMEFVWLCANVRVLATAISRELPRNGLL